MPPGSESHLEQSFRDLFTRRVTALGATVKESPGPQGNRLTITFPSATRQWTLEPQVLMTGSKPDFVLSSGQGGQLHGEATHASCGTRDQDSPAQEVSAETDGAQCC